MRRYLLDTNAVADWINRRRGSISGSARPVAVAVIGTCERVVAELFFGV